MSVEDSCNKRVTFNMQDGLEDKIDKLTTMIGKLAVRDSEVNRPFKLHIYQSIRRGQGRIFMLHLIMTIKISTDQIVEIEEFSLADKVEVDEDLNKTIGQEILGAMQGSYLSYIISYSLEDKIVEENIEVIRGMKIKVGREVGVV